MTRILLVEDHTAFRQALALMLDREEGIAVAAQAGSLAEAQKSLEGIDLAIVDLGLPDGDGAELIREFSNANPNIMTLVLSATMDPARFAEAAEAGASGVLHEAASLKDIVDAVRRLEAGENLLSPNEMIEMLRMLSRKRQEEYEARLVIEKLTRREREVLQAMAEGLDSRDIAKKLHITIDTERTHVVNILNKLGMHSRLQALVFAVGHGVVDID